MNFLLKSVLFVAICATSLIWQTFILLDLQVEIPVLLLVFLSTLFIYSFHRYVKLNKVKSLDYSIITTLNFRTLQFLIVITGLLITPLLFILSRSQLLLFVTCGVLTLWYSINIIPFRCISFTLRALPYLKVFLISLIWSGITVLLTIKEFNISTKEMMVFLERFFFIAAITIPFDIRDIERDSVEKIRTFPVILGVEGSKKLAYTFNILFLLIAIIAAYLEVQSFNLVTALFVSGIISFIFISGAGIKRSQVYYVFGVEGISLIQSLLVALTLIF